MTPYLAAVAGLALLPGCPLLEVEARVDETCATYHDIQVDGVPDGLPPPSQTFTFDDLHSINALASLDAVLTFARAEVRATSGISDFSFVRTADVEIASGDPSSTLPSLVVFRCEECATAESSLDLSPTVAADAKPYIDSGSLVVTVDFTGQAPPVAWSMEVDVCMGGTVSYAYSP